MIVSPFSVISDDNSDFIHVFATFLPDLNLLPVGRRHCTEHFYAYDALSSVLCKFYGISHSMLSLDEQGKPQLIHPFLHMNLAHSHGIAVCAVSSQPIGIDVEPPRKFHERMLKFVCTSDEQEQIISSNDAHMTFSRIWTLKEAYGKWHGGGIRLPLAEIPFSLSEAKIRFLHPDADNFAFYQGILPIDGISYVISVCSKQIQKPVISHDFTLFYTS